MIKNLLFFIIIFIPPLYAGKVIRKIEAIPKEEPYLSYGEAPMEYVVQPGDTLLDICDQLLNKPSYWKKLWALNPEIQNPNFIYPGMKLKFYPKNGIKNPALEIVRSAKNPAVESGIISNGSNLFRSKRFDLPGFNEDPFESLNNLEHSNNIKVDELFLTYPKAVADLSEDIVDVPGFILEAPVSSLCNVVSGDGGESLTVGGTGSPKSMCEIASDLSLNTTYTILRPREPILDESSKNVLGYLYEFIAHIRLESLVGDNKYALGTLYRTRTPVEEDDKVVPYMSTLRTFKNKANEEIEKRARVQVADGVRIVAFEEEGQEMNGLGSFVFLDKGSLTGIKINQLLSIHSFYSELVESGVLKNYPNQVKEIGTLRVIDVTPVGAVGYVMRSKQEVKVGDFVGI